MVRFQVIHVTLQKFSHATSSVCWDSEGNNSPGDTSSRLDNLGVLRTDHLDLAGVCIVPFHDVAWAFSVLLGVPGKLATPFGCDVDLRVGQVHGFLIAQYLGDLREELAGAGLGSHG